jgi:DNA-binding MarR family transcriptional regulator
MIADTINGMRDSVHDSRQAEDLLVGCTNFKLRQLTRRVTHEYDREVSKAGLKTTQYSLLSCVLKLGPVRPGDLARAMTMDASTMTRNVKPLIAAGWLELAAGADGRTRTLTITPAGREKRTEAKRCWKVAQERLERRLGPQRVRALHALLDESLERLGTPVPDDDDE